MEKSFLGRKVITHLPELPWASQLFLISLQNLANRLHEKQKVGSAGRVTRLAKSPFLMVESPS